MIRTRSRIQTCIFRVICNLLLSLFFAGDVSGNEVALKPYRAVPTERQLRWHEMEFYGFLHFGINTFTDREWGMGDESPELFNPTDFDANQIVKLAKESGMKGLVLVCKHHDGFCLWPSRYTEHSVKASPWRGGKGDLVKEVSDACHAQGIKFGVYLSPWDRNHKDYGRPEYLTYYRNQLSELLTNYGEVFMTWHDGASGGEGFYGGSREKRLIDNQSYYQWPEIWDCVRKLQPKAVILSDAGPDVRWVGNERGAAGIPCWYTMELERCYPGMPNYFDHGKGHRGGRDWCPPECNISLRPWWFYHPRDDEKAKTSQQLVDIYYGSVGLGASLNLNLSPDKRGRIADRDAEALRGMHRWLDETFAVDLARSAKMTASNVRRGTNALYAADNVIDGKRDTFWATDDGETTPYIVAEFSEPISFNVIRIREYLPLGQRVMAFAVDQWKDGEWNEFFAGRSIGSQRLVRVPRLNTSKIRLRITKSPVCPAISEFGVFEEPGQPSSIEHK